MTSISGIYSQHDVSYNDILVENLWTEMKNPKTFSHSKHADDLKRLQQQYPEECRKFNTFTELIKTIRTENQNWTWS